MLHAQGRYGLLRHLSLRSSRRTGVLLEVLENGAQFFRRKLIAERLRYFGMGGR